MKKYILILFILFVTGCSCGHIKNSGEIVSWVRKTYGINSKVISSGGNTKEGREFILKDKKHNITFNCYSYWNKIGFDGATFGKVASTDCDYHGKLTEYLEPQIKTIGNKYSVKFIRTDYEQLIDRIEINVVDEDDIEESHLENAKNAFNELNKLYNFKRLDDDNYYARAWICLHENCDLTKYFFKYTTKGKDVTLYDSNIEFYKRNKIPLQMEQDVINFANSLYGEGFKVINFEYIMKEHNSFDYDAMVYVVQNKEKGLLKELGFNVESYSNDYRNDNLKSMDYYYNENIKSNSTWFHKYEFN